VTVRIVVGARRSGKLRLAAELVAWSVIRCRLIGVLHMEDDGGVDDS
jgi:inorganic pyrophosphatase